MLKTIFAALLAVSVLAAPAMAATRTPLAPAVGTPDHDQDGPAQQRYRGRVGGPPGNEVARLVE